MKVPFTIADFLYRAENAYSERIALVDEPGAPGGDLGELTWSQFAQKARSQAAKLDQLGIGQGERVAMVSQNSGRLMTSFYGVSGYGRVFVPINAITGLGGKHVVLREVRGEDILKRVEEHNITLMCGAPAVVSAVLEAAQNWPGEIPGKGRVRMVVAGAPPPTKTIARMQDELGWEFIQIYGLTETAPLLTMNRTRAEWDHLDPEEKARKLSRAGAPAVGVKIKIDDQGEILARSNVVLEGYWEQPQATAEAIVDGWFHTGDGGTLDNEHHLTISDRKKDVIISGGENVSSIEVEDVLFGHPCIAEVAVIGVPHEKWGETVKALVVIAEGESASEQELIEYCREKMAHYKCPTSIEVRDELARTATGKLQKFKLRAPYWDGMSKQIN